MSFHRWSQSRQELVLDITNWIGAVLHAINTFGTLALFLLTYKDTFRGFLTTTTLDGNLLPDKDNLGRVAAWYILIWFSPITSFFHLALSTFPGIRPNYHLSVFKRNRNPYRWIEYSITASIMTWVIMMLSGVVNLFLLIDGVFLNVAMNIFGYVLEVVMQGTRPEKKRLVFWKYLFFGFVPFVPVWLNIFYHFFSALSANSSDVPWYVWSIVFGMCGAYLLFPLVLILHYNKWPKFMGYPIWKELGFIFSSWIAKTMLVWFLAIGLYTAGP